MNFLPGWFGNLEILLKAKQILASWILGLASLYLYTWIYSYAGDKATWLGRLLDRG